jgi:processive 1,2-diacylglycerol beta-glucosyltransferase
MRRVLLLSASSGAGHVRAAQALEKAFAARGDCAVEHVDALDYTSKLFQKIYDDAYIAIVRRAPDVLGWIYDRMDQAWKHQRRRLALDRLNSGPMIRLVRRVQPDLCIATHFLPAEIIAWLKAKGKITAKHAIVITDFDVHAMWLCRTVDRYFVAIPESAEYLEKIGVPENSIRVTGIPVDPVFAESVEPRVARERLSIDPHRKTILVSAGGYALGPVERLVGDLLALERPWQIVAVAGKSEKTKQRLDALARDAAKRPDAGRHPMLHAVGFTKEMQLWMAAADLLVGKAGGLTVSEALARQLPMAIIEPIPGQEERNSDHLLEAGAAIRCNNFVVAAAKIARLLDDDARLARMRAAAASLAHPNAAAQIVSESLALLKREKK